MMPHIGKKGNCIFIGILNYCQNMHDKGCHIIQPLNDLNLKKMISIEQEVFDEIKCITSQRYIIGLSIL